MPQFKVGQLTCCTYMCFQHMVPNLSAAVVSHSAMVKRQACPLTQSPLPPLRPDHGFINHVYMCTCTCSLHA